MNRLYMGVFVLLIAALIGCVGTTDPVVEGLAAPHALPAGRPPAPCDGPSLQLPFLALCKLSSASPGPCWCRGIYESVDFTYTSAQPAAQLASLYEKATGLRSQQNRSGGWVYDRKVGTVHQQCVIRANDDHESFPDAAARVIVNESANPMAGMPTRWYCKAVAPNPPAPLQDVPFRKGIRADAVTVTSLGSLESSAGVYIPGADACIYEAVLRADREGTLSEIRRWAAANGYGEVNPNDFFKPGSGCFEFAVGSRPVAGGQAIGVTWYVSDKKADHPIARIKI